MGGPRWLVLLAAILADPAGARTIATSPAPDRVAVTVYRDPHRDPSQAFDLEWLDGYALISETRQVTLPAGESELRFEGVAGGIVPQSAIVTGFPEGIVERNHDALLLSPGTLLDRSLGRRVRLRRTSLATGVVREQDAIVRSGAEGAVVLQTGEGFEALRCTGLRETPVYEEVPPGLSARPTLSVRARSRRPLSATVTLSYLASGFDWQANYIARLAPAGDRIDLFAWLTLASGDETSFVAADTQAVAGRLNREEAEEAPAEGRPLVLSCWPQGSTSDIPEEELVVTSPVSVVNSQEVRLTGTVRTEDLINSLPQAFARQEELGDLKLYRIPEPVTVAARSQKQVALFERTGVPVELVYRYRFSSSLIGGSGPFARVLVTRNLASHGLGLPLPGGGLVLFAGGEARAILVGQGDIDDTAVGEEVEALIGEATGVNYDVVQTREGDAEDEFLLTVTNDRAEPVRLEADFDTRFRAFRSRRRLPRRDGRPIWAVTLPARGSATLRYAYREHRR
jgi:hypothetical protein